MGTQRRPASKFQTVKTVNDHLLAEVASALQKSIRRGLMDDAVYWVVELDESGYAQYAWRRLLIITSEDVGPAWPEGPAVIRALFDNWVTATEGRDRRSAPLFLIDAVIRLCRAPKSRIVDHVTAVHYSSHRELRREIPDYAFDSHTSRGRRMGRSIDHFLDEAAVVFPEADDPDVDEYRERERTVLKAKRRRHD